MSQAVSTHRGGLWLGSQETFQFTVRLISSFMAVMKCKNSVLGLKCSCDASSMGRSPDSASAIFSLVVPGCVVTSDVSRSMSSMLMLAGFMVSVTCSTSLSATSDSSDTDSMLRSSRSAFQRNRCMTEALMNMASCSRNRCRQFTHFCPNRRSVAACLKSSIFTNPHGEPSFVVAVLTSVTIPAKVTSASCRSDLRSSRRSSGVLHTWLMISE